MNVLIQTNYLQWLFLVLTVTTFPAFALGPRAFWSSDVIEKELANRQKMFQVHISKKYDESLLYVAKGDLKAASAVLTLLKATTVGVDPRVTYLSAYLDSRLGRTDSALRSLKELQTQDTDLQLKRCFLWLKILWKEERWQEIDSTMSDCRPVLSSYSVDELFYAKNFLHMKTKQLDVSNISPTPFFYFFSPDYLKIEQWLSLIIQEQKEDIALPHLLRIPEESLIMGRVRLLTAIALWNAGNKEESIELWKSLTDKSDWNATRLSIAIALEQHDNNLAWETNRELLNKRGNLESNKILQVALDWQKQEGSKDVLEKNSLEKMLNYDPEVTPLLAVLLAKMSNESLAQKILQKYQPGAKASHEFQLSYWGVRQWLSLKGQAMGNFLQDAESACNHQVSFGCWMLLSGQEEITLDKSDQLPYDSVGQYFIDRL